MQNQKVKRKDSQACSPSLLHPSIWAEDGGGRSPGSVLRGPQEVALSLPSLSFSGAPQSSLGSQRAGLPCKYLGRQACMQPFRITQPDLGIQELPGPSLPLHLKIPNPKIRNNAPIFQKLKQREASCPGLQALFSGGGLPTSTPSSKVGQGYPSSPVGHFFNSHF